jgi:hypothetical protein
MNIKTTANSFLKVIGHIALSTVGAVFTLVLVFMVVVAVQTGIHGNEAFGHDAGADSTLTLGSVFAYSLHSSLSPSRSTVCGTGAGFRAFPSSLNQLLPATRKDSEDAHCFSVLERRNTHKCS